MRERRIHHLLAGLLVIPCLAGCAFTVKNTDGLALAYRDIDRATSYASELKSMTGVDKNEENAVADLYRQARANLNSYLRKAITDASDYIVDSTKEDYLATSCAADVNDFEKKVKDLRRSQAITAAVWLPIAAEVIKAIWDANQQSREEGRRIFVDTVTRYMMKEYEEIAIAKGPGTP